MSAIHRRDTKAELLVRRALWAIGVRGYRIDAALPGRPDIHFPRFGLCVFIDGCFWHACPKHFNGVKSNMAYWAPKIARNQARDTAVTSELRSHGYVVRRYWEHLVKPDDGYTVAFRILTELEKLRNRNA